MDIPPLSEQPLAAPGPTQPAVTSIKCSGRQRRFMIAKAGLEVYQKLSMPDKKLIERAIGEAPDVEVHPKDKNGGNQELKVKSQGRRIKVHFNKSEEWDEIRRLELDVQKEQGDSPPPLESKTSEMPLYEIPSEPLKLIGVSAKFRKRLSNLLDRTKPSKGSRTGVSVNTFKRFVANFIKQYGNQVTISENGSHCHIQTLMEPPVSFGLWKPHFKGEVHQNTHGVGNALEIMDKICFVPDPE
ncbi:MAG: hypothetical protein LBI47_01740 [Puniceicoccales bacterium]|jgi:hypothetical protein|nr:hypothetical protein [Puniceicoccales bacterium]